MATAYAAEGFFRLPRHWLEFAALHAIGAADDLLRHSFPHSWLFNSRRNFRRWREPALVPQGRHGTAGAVRTLCELCGYVRGVTPRKEWPVRSRAWPKS